MKTKISAVLFALFILTSMSFAQSSDFSKKISIGVKVGANLSNVYDSQDKTMQADPKFGLAVGGFVQIPLGEYFGIQPEVLFSQRGYKGSGSILGSNYNYSLTANYIDIPLLVAVKPSKMVTLLVGPQYSYLISQKYAFNSAIVNTQQEEQFNNDDVRKNTLCITGGADFNFDQIVVGVRAGLDVSNNKSNGTSTTPRYKNVWYQATVGYRF